MIDSTSDERTENNVFRHEYRPLTEEEKALMREIKDAGAACLKLIEQVKERKRADGELSDDVIRACAIAKTKSEEMVMWAVKGLTA